MDITTGFEPVIGGSSPSEGTLTSGATMNKVGSRKRHNDMPNHKGTYSIEEIKIGFERFLRERGHYPTAPEIDMCAYLPSARQMQRNFGGLPKLREQLGLVDTNFGVGKFRSAIAGSRNRTGFKAERDLERILIDHFGEPFVHVEKPIDETGRRRFDFFIYARDVKFGIDVFYSETKHDIQNNVNIKIDNYTGTSVPVYFVLANTKIPQSVLDEVSLAKSRKPIPSNIKLVAMDNFLELVNGMRPHKQT